VRGHPLQTVPRFPVTSTGPRCDLKPVRGLPTHAGNPRPILAQRLGDFELRTALRCAPRPIAGLFISYTLHLISTTPLCRRPRIFSLAQLAGASTSCDTSCRHARRRRSTVVLDGNVSLPCDRRLGDRRASHPPDVAVVPETRCDLPTVADHCLGMVRRLTQGVRQGRRAHYRRGRPVDLSPERGDKKYRKRCCFRRAVPRRRSRSPGITAVVEIKCKKCKK